MKSDCRLGLGGVRHLVIPHAVVDVGNLWLNIRLIVSDFHRAGGFILHVSRLPDAALQGLKCVLVRSLLGQQNKKKIYITLPSSSIRRTGGRGLVTLFQDSSKEAGAHNCHGQWR